MYGKNYDQNHGMDNQDFPEWVAPKLERTFYGFCHPLHLNNNLICSKKDTNFLTVFKNLDLLIIGGGGSTNKFLDINNIGKWDSVWSLNHFYKNDKLKNNKSSIHLISLGPEINLQDKDLLKYIDNYWPIVGFELHQKWSREQVDSPLVKEVNDFYNNNLKFCFQTKYFSILGSGARLVILACELGVKSISFVGFDGPQAIWNADHSFEKGKNFMTYRCQGYSKEQVIKMFQDEYNWFWNYIKTTYPNVKVQALEDPYKYHEVLFNF